MKRIFAIGAAVLTLVALASAGRTLVVARASQSAQAQQALAAEGALAAALAAVGGVGTTSL